jgi:hypothetical protein
MSNSAQKGHFSNILVYIIDYFTFVPLNRIKGNTMNPENENLSANQSLDIITGMIEKARGNVQQNRLHFILWGLVIAAANLGMFALLQVDYPRPYLVWLITIPAWIVSMFYGIKQGQKARVVTHIDRTTMWLWISFGISVFILVFFGYTIKWNLNPVILLISAIPTLVSGIVIRFRPLVLGGVSLWFFGIICFLVDYEYQFLIGAVAVLVGYLVPGVMLKDKTE